jgi:Rieske Fe-S protein
MAVGRRVLIRNAALLTAAGGCARRIPPSRDVRAEIDSLFQIHLKSADAPELQNRGGSVALHLFFSDGSEYSFGVLVANLGTALLACQRDCPHSGCELTWIGEDREVECPCHGSRFASDGALLNGPAVTDLLTFPIALDASGDYTIRLFPGDGTYPLPDANRRLTLDLASYPALTQVDGAVSGVVEGPPGPLVVLRTASAFSALGAVCPHLSCRVRPRNDGTLRCPCHGSEFRSDGSVIQGPAASSLRSFPAQLSGPQLIIELG